MRASRPTLSGVQPVSAGASTALPSQIWLYSMRFPPRVWALVDPPNTASHALLDRHNFRKLDAEPGGYDFRYLPRAKPGLF
jgi:hypothetical protein